MYSSEFPVINTWANANAYNTFKTIEFVIATAHRKFSFVPSVLRRGYGFSGMQLDAIDTISAGRNMVYRTIQAKRENDVELMVYLTSLPGLGVVKAGFVAQMLAGTVGCLDTWNIKDTVLLSLLHPYVMPKRTTVVDHKRMRPSTIAERIAEYCMICTKLGSAFLWDNWCATLARQYDGVAYPWKTAQEVSTFHLVCLGLA